ncbi:globoside alpha-1,3-N-acetylgalactosaminyltransferase 1-like isoform X1 [Acipenser ruthenus]|uniref:globoside alpha-1,3-N-acetylgalactosaminyltransferase 1-like isoform X1 n=1 Tax=Acipenser ruthenus TaxID=7906 RepID=UPI001560FA18|nr:globoside alpha-1,3-N-acetylgalactosaminyltransferase 1-like isoform X1 [Acipenser ruthenus]XP_058861329.1 globoside alpha-1,3-N-acetylgalactosaminyltransferase 1-like isoform X1 [Acipenser ruthenus]
MNPKTRVVVIITSSFILSFCAYKYTNKWSDFKPYLPNICKTFNSRLVENSTSNPDPQNHPIQREKVPVRIDSYSTSLRYPQPQSLKSPRLDVMTVTPWLAPVIWDGTFDSSIIDSLYQPQNLTIGTTVFAIGKYTRFIKGFLETAEKHFLVGYKVNYYIFTDKPDEVPSVALGMQRNLSVITVSKFFRWQEISMRRMERILNTIEERLLKEVDYLYCLDVDMLFHNHWGAEVLSTLVAAVHPGYYKNPREVFPYERRPASQAYVPLDQGDFYYAGAMIGGLIENVRALTRTCHQAILIDKQNDIEAAWQEESHLNKYFLQHKPTKLLSPEYLWDDTKPKPPEIHFIRFSTVLKNYAEVRENV